MAYFHGSTPGDCEESLHCTAREIVSVAHSTAAECIKASSTGNRVTYRTFHEWFGIRSKRAVAGPRRVVDWAACKRSYSLESLDLSQACGAFDAFLDKDGTIHREAFETALLELRPDMSGGGTKLDEAIWRRLFGAFDEVGI